MAKSRNFDKGAKPYEKDKTSNHNSGRGANRNNRNSKPNSSATSVASLCGSGNDLSWYTNDPRLVADAVKIGFYNQAGITMPWNNYPGGAATGEVGMDPDPIAGIMSFDMFIGTGVAKNSSDGLNIASQGVFEFTRKNLSTVATYASADEMACILGIDNIYAMYAYILRIFGLINAYSNRNYYAPRALVRAATHFNDSGINNLIANLNIYRSRFNNLIYKAASLYMPVVFSLTNRHSWLFSNVFKDHDTPKSQLYVHRLGYYGVLDETKYETGTAIVYKAESAASMPALLEEFDEMIEAFRNSDSMRRIQADMRRAYGDKYSAWTLSYATEDYMIQPIYNKDVLSQIHNMDIMDIEMFETDSLDVTQDVDHNILISRPRIPSPGEVETGDWGALFQLRNEKKILNFFWDTVTDGDIVEATRNKIIMEPETEYDEETGITYWYMQSYGVDFCGKVTIYRLDAVTKKPYVSSMITSQYLMPIDINFDAEYTGNIAQLIADLVAFDWAPVFYMPYGNALTAGTVTGIKPVLDWDNWNLVDPSTLDRINNNIALSMWKVPEYGELSGTK